MALGRRPRRLAWLCHAPAAASLADGPSRTPVARAEPPSSLQIGAGPLVRRRVVVRGRVQGVFFRDTLRRQAESRSVAGWAMNRDDGAVEAVFEGPPEAVEALIDFCRRGPSRARVEDVEVREEQPEDVTGFRIA
jgi:acylphosphatase